MFRPSVCFGARSIIRGLLLKALALLATLSLLFPGLTPVAAANGDFGPLEKLQTISASNLGLKDIWRLTFDDDGNGYAMGNTNVEEKTRKIVKFNPVAGTQIAEVELTGSDLANLEIYDIAFVPRMPGATDGKKYLIMAMIDKGRVNNLAAAKGFGYVEITDSGFGTEGITQVTTSDVGRTIAKYYEESGSYNNPIPAFIHAGIVGSNNIRIDAWPSTPSGKSASFEGSSGYIYPYGNNLGAALRMSSSNSSGLYKYTWNTSGKKFSKNSEVRGTADTTPKAGSSNHDLRYFLPFISVNGGRYSGLYSIRDSKFALVPSAVNSLPTAAGTAFTDPTAYAFLAPDKNGKYTALVAGKKDSNPAIYYGDFAAADNAANATYATEEITGGTEIRDLKVAPNGLVGIAVKKTESSEVIIYSQKPEDAKVSDVQVVSNDDGKVRPVAPNVRGSQLTFSADDTKPSTLNLNTKTGEVTGTLTADQTGSFKVTVTGTGVTAMVVTYYYGKYKAGVDPSSTSVKFTAVGEANVESNVVSELWKDQYPRPYVDISSPAADNSNTVPAGLTFEPGSGKLSGVLANSENSPLVLVADNVMKSTLQTVTVSFEKIQDIKFKPEGGSEFLSVHTEAAVTGYSVATYSTEKPLATLKNGEWQLTDYSLEWTIAANGGLEGLENDGPTLIGTISAQPGVYTATLLATISGNPPVEGDKTKYTPFTVFYPVTVSQAPTLQNQYADVVYRVDNTINPTPAPQPGWTYSHFGLLKNGTPSAGGDLVGLTLNTADGVVTGQGMDWTSPHDPRLIVVYNADVTHTATYYLMGVVPLGLGAKLTQLTPEQAGVNIPVSVSGGPTSAYELVGAEGTEPGEGVWPKGLNINAGNGAVTGDLAAEVAEGVYTFGVKVKASSTETPPRDHTATASYTLIISKPRAVQSLETGIALGTEMNVPVDSTGLFTSWSADPAPAAAEGKQTGTAEVAGAGLPKGVVFNAADGSLGGTPDAAAGVYTFTVFGYGPSLNAAGDAIETETVSAVYTLTLAAAPEISAQAKDITAGAEVTIEATPEAKDGWGYAIETTDLAAPGAGLPKGLTIDAANGKITGQVAAEVTEGLYKPVVLVSAAAVNLTVSATYALLVRKDITLDAKAFGAAPGGAALTGVNPGVTGGPVASYELLGAAAKAGGADAYPSGLTLDTDSGVVAGQVAADVAEGVYTFGLKALGLSVNDPASTYSATALYTVTVLKNLKVADKAYEVGVGQVVTFTPTAEGAVLSWEAPAVVAAAGAGLPKGLEVNVANGRISGTVAADAGVGVYTVLLTAMGKNYDAAGVLADASASGTVLITVSEAPTVSAVTSTVIAGAQVTITPAPAASAGWSYTAADLPDGWEINTDSGVVSGVVDAATEFTVKVTATALTEGPLLSAEAVYSFVVVEKVAFDEDEVAALLTVGEAVNLPLEYAGSPTTFLFSGAAKGTEPGANVYPADVTVNESGVVTGTIAAGVKPGEYVFTVQAIGALEGNADTMVVKINVTTDPDAEPPVDPAVDPAAGGDPVSGNGDSAAGDSGSDSGDDSAGDSGNSGGDPATGGDSGNPASNSGDSGNGDSASGDGDSAGDNAGGDSGDSGGDSAGDSGDSAGDSADEPVAPGAEASVPAPADVPAAAKGFKANAPLGTEPGSNVIPSALNIDPADGSMKGKIGDNVKPGEYTFPVTYTDADGSVKTTSYTVTVAPKDDAADKPKAKPTPGAAASVPAPVDAPAGASNFGFGPGVSYATTPGSGGVPAVLFLGEDGSLSGKVGDDVQPGEYTFPVTYTDADGNVKTTSYTVTVAPKDAADKPKAKPTPGGSASVPAPVDAPAGASNFGFGPGVSYATTPGSGGVPAVLFIAEDGSLSGKIGENVQPGEYTFPVTYTDADGNVQTTNLTVTVAPKGSESGAGDSAGSAGGDTGESAGDKGGDSAGNGGASADEPKAKPTPGGSASIPAPVDAPAGASNFGFGPGVSYATTPGSGGVPAVLFIAEDGSLSGKIGENVQPGEYTFPVTYTDANGKVQTTNLTVTVAPKGSESGAGDSAGNTGDSAGGDSSGAGDKGGDSAPVVTVAEPVQAVITQNQLTNVAGVAGAVSYSFAPSAAYGTEPGANAVPSVLFLNADNGTLQGIVKGAIGIYTFGIDMTKADGSINRVTYLITVVPSVSALQTVEVVVTQSQLTSIAGANVPDAVSYSFAPGEAYSIEPGVNAVPSLLFLNTDNGTLQGIVKGATGVYTFGIDVTKTDRSTIRVTYRITVVSPVGTRS